METTATLDYERGLTFEKVWASIKELREEQRERAELFERQIKENEKRAELVERQMKESAKRAKLFEREMKASAKRLDKQLGYLGNRYGEAIEHMIRPNLIRKFRKLGFDFSAIFSDIDAVGESRILAEVDAFLENNNEVMIVEIKSKPSVDDIKEHMQRMDRLRVYADGKGDKRKYFGAIGGMVFNNNERDYALKCGFYIITPSGSTFNVIAPGGDFQPRVW